MKRPLIIAHLYPDLLNLYADKGNIRTLVKRLEWRGIEVEVNAVTLHDDLHLSKYDLVLLGGGSDREQALIGQTLRPLQQEWQVAAKNGLPILAICGGYQLIGEYYQLANGDKVEGLHLLDMITLAGEDRFIGNIAISNNEIGTIVGFENHGGRTYHSYSPLGKILFGHGNNGTDDQEGLHYMNIFGTYIHGPLLPKNPNLADLILKTALDYAGINISLDPLDDHFENLAHDVFLHRHVEDNS